MHAAQTLHLALSMGLRMHVAPYTNIHIITELLVSHQDPHTFFFMNMPHTATWWLSAADT